MERTEILDLMGKLKLFGMRAAFDEIIANGIKRRHEPQRIIGDLLKAELVDKVARSIKYQLAIAKLPLAKELADFQSKGTPINEALVRDLATGSFIAQQRNIVLAGGTGSGKTHLAIAIARSCIRAGARGRFYNVVDLVNRLEAESRNGRQGRIADYLTRKDFERTSGRPTGSFLRRKPKIPCKPTASRSLATALWGRARSRLAPPGSKLDADSGSNLEAD